MASSARLIKALFVVVIFGGCGFCQDILLLAPENGILKEYVTIDPGQAVHVLVDGNNLPGSADFVVFQLHTHNLPLTISYDHPPTGGNAITGNHVGLVVSLANATISVNGTSVGWVSNNEAVPVRGLIVVIGYSNTDPIPGGCNMEFALKVSPFLKMNFTEELDRLEFQRAGYGSGGGFLAASCDLARDVDELRYEVFYFDLPEKDTAEATFFSSLEILVSVDDLRTRAIKAKEVTLYEKPRILFNAFPGLGMIFGVVAYRASNYSQAAAYVPLATYSCHPFLDGGEDCNAVDNWFSWILCALAIFCGVLLILRGHRFFKTQLFFMAFAGFSFIGYIIFRNFIVPDHSGGLSSLPPSSVLIISTMALGFAGGTFWVALWKKSGLPFLVVMMPGFIMGALLGSILLYTPLVNLAIFRSDMNYWAVFGCCVLIVPLVLGANPRLLSIVSSSFVGSFAIVAAFDRYLGGTLVFSIINVVRRAVVQNFDEAYVIWPVQLTDVLLLGAWLLVATLGACIQSYFESGRPPFPPAGRWQSSDRPPINETTSLLISQGTPDREPLLFPDYQSSRPSVGSGGVGARSKRMARSNRGVVQPSEDALFARDSTASVGLSASEDEPPPPYYPVGTTLAPCVPNDSGRHVVQVVR